MENENGKLLCPKIDVVFHALFREDNKDLLGAMLSAVLKQNIKIKTIDKSRHINIKEADEKLGVLDLRAELEDGTQCNIEVQLQPHKYENERILYYWADTYSRQLLKGSKYWTLKKTISIAILEHEIEELKGIEEIGTKWQIKDELTGKRVLTDRLEIAIIEIPKARRIYKIDNTNELAQWMMFLDDPNKKEVSHIMEGNEDIKKAIEELEAVSGNEELAEIARLRLKAIRDEQAALEYAEEHGDKIGFDRGMKEGLAQGVELRNIEIAKNMIKMNLQIDVIEKATGLSKEEINKLKNNIN